MAKCGFACVHRGEVRLVSPVLARATPVYAAVQRKFVYFFTVSCQRRFVTLAETLGVHARSLDVSSQNAFAVRLGFWASMLLISQLFVMLMNASVIGGLKTSAVQDRSSIDGDPMNETKPSTPIPVFVEEIKRNSRKQRETDRTTANR